jgi:hypothetical protein
VSVAQRYSSDDVAADLPDRTSVTDALQRLADAERAKRRGSADLEPQAMAAHYFERLAGVFAIGVVDREYGLRWIQTRSPELLSLADIQSIEQVCDVLVRRPIDSVPTVVDREHLCAGGSGFVMGIPVLDRGRVASSLSACPTTLISPLPRSARTPKLIREMVIVRSATTAPTLLL